ncbi:MAG TPA: hypothetical protein VIJ28_13775 [Chloroflexota bacterium]
MRRPRHEGLDASTKWAMAPRSALPYDGAAGANQALGTPAWAALTRRRRCPVSE